MTNIHNTLPFILGNLLHNIALPQMDFADLMRMIQSNYPTIQPHLLSQYTPNDIKNSIKIRNIIAHQNPTSIDFLNHAIDSLKNCQKAFGIQSAAVPLRVLACKKCGTTITRTAQPSVRFRDLAGNKQKITRTYDVQSWVVANDNNEFAHRENTWYPGWVWTYTYCATCRQNNVITCLGFRFDWAPEDRIDLNTCRIRYSLPHQAMIVQYPNGQVRDLTHVVSDGEVRRHRYALYEKALHQAPYHP